MMKYGFSSVAAGLFAAYFFCSASVSGCLRAQDNPTAKYLFIENQKVKIGVDMRGGGGIFYFSEKAPERNLLNHFDKGRFIQQSYYGEMDGSWWGHTPWTWNPVQGGGYKNQPAKILVSSRTSNEIYIKTRPKHWATGADINDAYMEEWIGLDDNVATVHFRFTYTGTKSHPEADQELPAVFADYNLSNLVFYKGDKPWTNDTLTRKTPAFPFLFPNRYSQVDESWAAYVDDRDWGLGVYFPGTRNITFYRYKGDGSPGPTGSACSYFAPQKRFAIPPGFVHDYTIYLTIGTIDHIRNCFGTIRKKMEPEP